MAPWSAEVRSPPVAFRPPVPNRLICGRSAACAIRTYAAACSTRTAATRRSALLETALEPGGELTLEFLSPLRLEEDGRQLKTPDFSVLFRRLLYRIDELNRQFADQTRRDPQEVAYLHQLADQVRLMEAETRWHELWSNSSRKHDKTPLSGLTGRAVYRSRDWRPLLPWLVWGQAVQVGKSVTKGNGTYQIVTPAGTPYWSWL